MQKLKLITVFLRIIFVCILSGNGFSQTPLFKNYSIKDGLPSSETYRVHQDSKGYIWVVGDMGVSRFDGYRFQNYTTKDGLPENTILGLYEDYKHRIWFWSLSGQLAYFENEKIHPLTKVNKEMISKFQGGIINSIALDKNDTLHIGSFHIRGLFKVFFDGKNQSLIADTTTNRGIYIQEIDSYKNEAVLSLNTELFFYDNVKYRLLEHLFLIDKGRNKQHVKRKWGNFDYSNPNQKCIQLNSKKILISLDNEIWEIDQKRITQKIHFEKQIIYLKEGKEGDIWVGTYKQGIFLIQNGDFTKKPIQYLKGKSVSAVSEDTEGGIWFSTLENGIYYLSNQSFLHYNQSCGLMEERINALDVDETGIIWIGSENGIYSSVDKNKIKNYFLLYNRQESNLKYINAFKKGEIVIGGYGVYLIKERNILDSVTEGNKVFGSNSCVRARYDGKLWSGGYGNIYEIKGNKGNYYGCDFRINAMCEGEKGSLLVGGINGLWHFKNKQFIYLGNQHPLLKLRINDLKYNNKTIWIGTKEDGLIIKQGNRIYQIRENQGLISDFCKSVFVDKDGIVWVGTNKGLSRISFKKKNNFTHYQIYNYTTINRLISNEINQVVVKGNKVYVATNKGVTIFDKNNVKKNRTAPPIYITKLTVNQHLIPLRRNYNLAYDQNTFQISYVGLSYKNAGYVEYKYRLQGLIDTNWHYTKYTRVDFTTLPYGDYSFEVYAKNNDGYWSSKPAMMSFSIAPPFWHTWWFRILGGSVIIAGIFFFIRYRVRLIVKRAEEKTAMYKKAAEQEKEKSTLFQKASEMEMKFLSAQMNPHFTFNAMNSIQHFMLEHEPEKAQHYLAKYSKLIRKVLENNMEKFVPLDDELDMLEIYMEIESLRFSAPFEFEIDVCEELEEKEYQIPPMILQPYIENAIWHGIFHKKEGIGKITLSFCLEDNRIKCIIEDNGVGRKRAKELNSSKKEHRSLGMLITQERLQHLQADSDIDVRTKISDILNENGEICGTRVEVCLPLNSHPSVQK